MGRLCAPDRSRKRVRAGVQGQRMTQRINRDGGDGFEQLLGELADLLRTDPDNFDTLAAIGAKYGLESDPEGTARAAAEHGLIERSAHTEALTDEFPRTHRSCPMV